MEIKFRDKISLRSLTGKITGIKTALTKPPQSPLKVPDSIGENFAYTSSPEHGAHVLEAELRKARATAEAHRRRMRIL
jgi:hypothetical protein